MKVYLKLHQLIMKYKNERALAPLSGATHDARSELHAFFDRYIPHGSGLDGKMSIDLYRSNANRIVIDGANYHHMNDHGMYVGWSYHNVIITPSFDGSIDVQITGRDRNGIKEYLATLFYSCLTYEVEDVDKAYAECRPTRP